MKLISFNVSIKLDNTSAVIELLDSVSADFIALQESMIPHDDNVFPQYRSGDDIKKHLEKSHPYEFFAPLFIATCVEKNGRCHRDFGGRAEQGTQLLSKYPIESAQNLFYYNEYKNYYDATNFREKDFVRSILSAIVKLPSGKKFKIINVHGIWNADNMGDQRTIKQSEFIINEFKKDGIPTIVCGDFNLVPESESVKMFDHYFVNLVNENGVKTTRPVVDDGLDRGDEVVDYILVSQGIKINDYKVMESAATDHYPLILDFDMV